MKQKILHRHIVIRFLALIGLGILMLLSLSRPLTAQTVTQGYGSDSEMQRGMIVALKQDDPTKIITVNSSNMESMHGVVVSSNDAPVTLSNDGEKIFVATVGRYDVLVSTENGIINPGDFITASSYDGIGMKADKTQNLIVGKALNGFDGQSGAISNANTANKSVVIGRIPVDISVSHNPLAKTSGIPLPDFLRTSVELLVHKQVSPVRVYMGLLLFMATMVIVGAIIYSSIRNGLISIGRNPLSKKMIIRNMLQAIIVGIIIFITGLFGVYLLLRL
jgi:hypothetical protein